jgi:hypothetical protein
MSRHNLYSSPQIMHLAISTSLSAYDQGIFPVYGKWFGRSPSPVNASSTSCQLHITLSTQFRLRIPIKRLIGSQYSSFKLYKVSASIISVIEPRCSNVSSILIASNTTIRSRKGRLVSTYWRGPLDMYFHCLATSPLGRLIIRRCVEDTSCKIGM